MGCTRSCPEPSRTKRLPPRQIKVVLGQEKRVLLQLHSVRFLTGRWCQARQGILAGAWAGAAGLWVRDFHPLDAVWHVPRLDVHAEVRNFSWNFAFFEWKRFLHNAVDNSPANAPAWFEAHLDWLRSRSLKTWSSDVGRAGQEPPCSPLQRGLEKKNQANVLTFEAATLGLALGGTYSGWMGSTDHTYALHHEKQNILGDCKIATVGMRHIPHVLQHGRRQRQDQDAGLQLKMMVRCSTLLLCTTPPRKRVLEFSEKYCMHPSALIGETWLVDGWGCPADMRPCHAHGQESASRIIEFSAHVRSWMILDSGVVGIVVPSYHRSLDGFKTSHKLLSAEPAQTLLPCCEHQRQLHVTYPPSHMP